MWGLSGARDLDLGISASTCALRTGDKTTKPAPCAFGNTLYGATLPFHAPWYSRERETC